MLLTTATAWIFAVEFVDAAELAVTPSTLAICTSAAGADAPDSALDAAASAAAICMPGCTAASVLSESAAELPPPQAVSSAREASTLLVSKVMRGLAMNSEGFMCD